jgi:ATP-dependent helicase HrpA
LQAVRDDDTVTKMGKTISRLPIDPRLARMMIEAERNACLNELLVIVSVLSVQDPRDLSAEKRQAANEKFRVWQDASSDFIGWINLWNEIEKQKKGLSRNHFAKWCRQQYLSWLRVREWQDIHRQLREQARELKLRFNGAPAEQEQVHRSILSGIPSHLATLDQDQIYQTTRGRQTTIFPGSALGKKTPKWIMAFSLIDTGKLYAHGVAGMQPQWAVSDLQHLHQYDYYEPYWQEREGRVSAFRNTRIYGLLIEGGKRVNYASVNPKESRQIFIREALVEGRYRSSVDFIRANRKLINFYREQEERERRRDLLIGDDELFDFYDHRLPTDIVDAVSFEAWAKHLNTTAIKNLTLFEQDVLATEHEKDTRSYPEYLKVKNQRLSLSYVFDPADEADGVSVGIPLAILNQFNDADFDYLVPGLLDEKIEALIRSLPKSLRRNFIPVPDYAKACTRNLDSSKPLYAQLSAQLLRMTGVRVEERQWSGTTIDAHYQMRFCLERDGVCVASGRSLASLQQEYGNRAAQSFEQEVQQQDSIAREGLLEWDFDRLPGAVEIHRDGSAITAFPALVDYQQSVAIELLETHADAAFYHPSGVARLISFALKDAVKYCHKKLPHIDQSALMYLSQGSCDELVDDIVMSSIFGLFLVNKLPANREQFEQCVEAHRGDFIGHANQIAELVYQVLTQYRAVRGQLDELSIGQAHRVDIAEQCDYLVYAGFVRTTPAEYLLRLPIYFQALQKRIDKTQREPTQADRALPLVRELWDQYLEMAFDGGYDPDQVEQLRWMIEEFRISCFAQPMKPRKPVSETRIRRLMGELSGA